MWRSHGPSPGSPRETPITSQPWPCSMRAMLLPHMPPTPAMRATRPMLALALARPGRPEERDLAGLRVPQQARAPVDAELRPRVGDVEAAHAELADAVGR